MPPKVTLPKASKDAFAINPSLEKILRRQWAVDPAWLKHVKPDILERISLLQSVYEADVAKLETQIQARYTEFVSAAAKIAQKG